MAFEWTKSPGFVISVADPGSIADSVNIDSNFVYRTSGDVFTVRVVAVESFTSQTISLYLYCPAVTGTPDFQMEIRAGAGSGEDADRPLVSGAADLASSPNTVSLGTGDAGTWVGPFTATVSMTKEQTYFLLIKNTSGSPTTNHAQFRYNGPYDGWGNVNQSSARNILGAGYNDNATNFAGADPTMGTGVGCVVVKFPSGALLGFPYVANGSAHANNQNKRGNRYQLDASYVISGMAKGLVQTPNLSGAAVYTAAGASVVSSAGDAALRSQGLAPFRFDPTTLAAGVAHDFVIELSANSAVGTPITMGEIEANVPADVLACRPFGAAYVEGATAGSFNVDTSQLLPQIGPIVDNFAACAAGGGGGRRPRLEMVA